MKNVIISFVLMLFNMTLLGQSLPNSDFDSWIDYGPYEDPQFWNTPNEYLILFGQYTVSKSTDAYSGDYSAMLETKFLSVTNVPGVITLAQINVDLLNQTYSIDGGIALHENVSKLTGMYKYEAAGNDSAMILIYNFKRDSVGEMDTIGYGISNLGNASTWTPFTVNMDNLNTHIPDTFNVIILSSGAELHAGSILYVDSLAIETNTGIFNLDDNRMITKVYPNPSPDIVYFEASENNKDRILRIFNVSGKLVSELDFREVKTKLNVKKYPIGIYTYQVTKHNRILSSGSFIKQ
ncbi:MAG: T9SS type A sorting domain-containing protein [Bacteroidetes bacterium]|nr:T9SS type A sorting domain-containing protein [Bacteroidota bacterium]